VSQAEAAELKYQLTAIIEREEDGNAALGPELDVSSQGESVEQARENLREALELFFESAPAEEITRRLAFEMYVTQLEVSAG
jgi:predicted RNase H-like HicB family nuclease